MRARSGFIVADILVVLFVFLLLAALVVPIFLDSGMTANELAAAANLKTIAAAVKNYKTATGNFPRDLAALATNKPPFLDPDFADGAKDGYNFSYKITGPGNFMVVARPQAYRTTGIKSFFADGSGIIRYTKADAEPRLTDSFLQ